MNIINLDRSKLIWFILGLLIAFIFAFSVLGVNNLDTRLGMDEKRVIKCTIPLAEELNQNLFYVAVDIKQAKKELFNSKKGVYFDNKLFVKTEDFEGNKYIIPFEDIECDSVGYEVTSYFENKG